MIEVLIKHRGFSLIEIMVSLVVIALLSTIAIPAVGNLFDRNRTKSVAILFQDSLRQARYESRTHSNASVTFCAVQANINRKTRCVTNDNKRRFENGWQWFVDNNGNGTYEPADNDELLGNTYESDQLDMDILVSDKIENNAIIYTNGKAYIEKANSATGSAITPYVTFTNKQGGTSTVYFDNTGRSTLEHELY